MPISSMIDSTAPRSFKEWITAFITYDDDEAYAQHYRNLHPGDDGDPDDAGTHGTAPGPGGSYYDDLDLDVDDGMLESFVIIGLAVTLLVLVQLRQRALRRARGEGPPVANNNNNNSNNNGARNNQQGAPQGQNGQGPEAQHQDEDRGLFPRPDDPDFAAWVAGGVGH